MVENSLVTASLGWIATAAGIAGLLGLIFIILFFAIGQPFGTLNDICIALSAVLSAGLAWKTYSIYHAHSPLLSLAGLILACLGAVIVVAGTVLVVSGKAGWFLAGLYMAAGNALIGLWLLGLCYAALKGSPWPHWLVILGLVSGGIMTFGLATIPGILKGLDSMKSAPWFVSYIGQMGALGYLMLYPIWCVLAGRVLLLKLIV